MQRTGNYLDKVIINKYALSVTLTAWENKLPIPDNTKSSLMSMSLSHSIKLILTKWLHTIPQKFVKLIVKLFYTMIETDPGLNLLGTLNVIWKYSNLFNKKVSCMQNKEDNKYYGILLGSSVHSFSDYLVFVHVLSFWVYKLNSMSIILPWNVTGLKLLTNGNQFPKEMWLLV